jgi:uncharacterized protein (TIRG00374 family)
LDRSDARTANDFVKLRTTVVALLTVVLLGWFLRGADPAGVWAHVQQAQVGMLLLAVACVAGAFWLRAVRWQCMVAPIGPTRFRSAFRATVIGFAALGVLPARAGDVIRPYLLAREEGLQVSAVFATVVLERVLDLIAVLALLAVFVFGAGDATTLPDRLRGPIMFSAAVGAGAAVALLTLMWVMASHPERVGGVVLAATRVLPRGFGTRLAGLASTFASGLAVARDPRLLLRSLAWSMAVWVVTSAEAWAVTNAFGIDLPFLGSFLLQAFLVIGIAVPTPGGVGGYHEAYRFATTTFFHAPNDRAVAAALVVHAISFVPVVLLAIVFMFQDGLSVGRLQEMARSTSE